MESPIVNHSNLAQRFAWLILGVAVIAAVIVLRREKPADQATTKPSAELETRLSPPQVPSRSDGLEWRSSAAADPDPSPVSRAPSLVSRIAPPATNSPAQQSGYQFGGRRGRGSQAFADGEFNGDRRGVPDWEYDEAFEHDVFRFVRVKYQSLRTRYNSMGDWATDFPDSDLNFSFRLHQLTTLEVNPDPLYLEIGDDRLFDYPFLYMIEPGELYFLDNEVPRLRRYLLNGGFLMVDDFWGESEWANFEREISRVFPDREIIDVPLEHEIFHCVYDLPEKPQVPSIHHWQRSGGSSERWDSDEVHFRAILDDDERIMVFICHNTDLGDGWEREGESREYFELFSEKKAYPMGINIVFYAMTH